MSPPDSRVSLRSTRPRAVFGFCCNLLKIAAAKKSAAAPMARARRTPTLE
jgi:hypothetical protein